MCLTRLGETLNAHRRKQFKQFCNRRPSQLTGESLGESLKTLCARLFQRCTIIITRNYIFLSFKFFPFLAFTSLSLFYLDPFLFSFLYIVTEQNHLQFPRFRSFFFFTFVSFYFLKITTFQTLLNARRSTILSTYIEFYIYKKIKQRSDDHPPVAGLVGSNLHGNASWSSDTRRWRHPSIRDRDLVCRSIYQGASIAS